MGRLLRPWMGNMPDEESPLPSLPFHPVLSMIKALPGRTMAIFSTIALLLRPTSATAQATETLSQKVDTSSTSYIALSLWVGALSILFNFRGHGILFLQHALKSMHYLSRNDIPKGVVHNGKRFAKRIVSGERISEPVLREDDLCTEPPNGQQNRDSEHAGDNSGDNDADDDASCRTVAECVTMHKSGSSSDLSNPEVVELALRGIIPAYSLEKCLNDPSRAVRVRRAVISRTANTRQVSAIETSLLPYKDYDYTRVQNACAENVIGYLPIPVGVAGPIRIDGSMVFLPMATTEGALIASTSRGAKAINAGLGAITAVTSDAMTRGPVVRFSNVTRAAQAKQFIDSAKGKAVVHSAMSTTSAHVRLQDVTVTLAGSYLYMRFKASTGEAMGMNMMTKGTERALEILRTECGFDDMQIVSLSGNYCTDKKAAAINWIGGRGKSVVAQAIIPDKVVTKMLKCSVSDLVHLNTTKNLVGSALAGASTGGFNAQSANVVTAMFLATGQDPAQNVSSSNCITMMEETLNGDLEISVSLPSMEVGTIGGGTILEPQRAMLDLVGCRSDSENTAGGSNASMLARIIAGGVLAGELSLCSALVTGELVSSHLQYNRKDQKHAEPGGP